VSRADATRRGAPNGLVVAAHRRHYVVDLDDGSTIECVLKGRAITLACGDRVEVARAHGAGVIVGLAPRTSLLYRSDAFAAAHASAGALVAALIKLYEDNAATLTPDPEHSAFYDSHPPAAIRVARLSALAPSPAGT
jgi:hypothetical protein